MSGTITVEQALKKGLWKVKVPLMLTFVGFLATSCIVAYFIGIQIFYGTVFGFVIGGLCTLLLSSYLTVRWRIWAFTNVDDVHELRQAAITEQLLPADGSWLGKYELASDADKAQLLALECRFLEPFAFNDDYTLPDEVILYRYPYSIIILGGICILFGCIMLMIFAIAGSVFILFGTGILFLNQKFVKANTKRKPFITIGTKGIAIELHDWKDISNERIVWERTGKNRYYYLIFDHRGGSERINLSNAGIKTSYLNHLLYVYRRRQMQQKARM
jgi:hypothetical protein